MKEHTQGGLPNKRNPPEELRKFYGDSKWAASYLQGLIAMLDSINNGRYVHEIANIKQGIKLCLTLIQRGKDPSDWCIKHLPNLGQRTKKIYREWLSTQQSSRKEYFDG